MASVPRRLCEHLSVCLPAERFSPDEETCDNTMCDCLCVCVRVRALCDFWIDEEKIHHSDDAGSSSSGDWIDMEIFRMLCLTLL